MDIGSKCARNLCLIGFVGAQTNEVPSVSMISSIYMYVQIEQDRYMKLHEAT